jgi:hypothetical protein
MKMMITLVVSTTLLTTPVLAQTQSTAEVTLDFDTSEIGRTPRGFSTALTGGGGPGAWIVQEDSTAPSGKQVLTQTSADGTSYRFPLLVYDDFTAKDVDVSVKFKPIAGKVDQAAGLMWRYLDQDNYYVVRANALEANVVLYKVENGKRSDLKPVGSGFLAYGKKAQVPHGRWSTLRVVVTRDRSAVYLNGEHLFAVEDNTFTGAGKIGIWTKADSMISFDDLHVISYNTTE